MQDNRDTNPDIILTQARLRRNQATLNIELGLSTRTSITSSQGGAPAGGGSSSISGGLFGDGGGGVPGGGDGGDTRVPCLEIGMPATFLEGSIVTERHIEHEDWVAVKVGKDLPVLMDPETLVAIWVKARNLKGGELADVGDKGEFEPITSAVRLVRKSIKVGRTVEPYHWYRGRRLKVHNRKIEEQF